jgi:hypothetical protein
MRVIDSWNRIPADINLKMPFLTPNTRNKKRSGYNQQLGEWTDERAQVSS